MPAILLPPLENDVLQFQPGPNWNQKALADLRKFAAELKVQITEGRQATASRVHALSLPSPWARLLLFDHALRLSPQKDKKHPARDQVEAEWRGLLGFLVLSQWYESDGGRLETKVVNLTEQGGLQEMAPKNTGLKWDRLHLFLWNGTLIGGTSPLTGVFTGRRNLSADVPFVDEKSGRFADPVAQLAAFLNDAGLSDDDRLFYLSQLEHLAGFLETVQAEAESFGNVADGVERASVRKLFESWLDATRAELDRHRARSVSVELLNEQLVDDGAQVLIRRIRPAEAIRRVGTKSPFQVAGMATAVEIDDGALLLDRSGKPVTGKIHNPGRSPVEFIDGRLKDQSAIVRGSVGRRDLFTPKLVKVEVPGGSAAVGDRLKLLKPSTRQQYYLYPIRQEALEQFGTGLLDSVYAEVQSDTNQLEVRVRLPLVGGRFVEYRRGFDLGDLVEADFPGLWLWPNFASAEWNHYYWFSKPTKASDTSDAVLRLSPIPVGGMEGELREQQQGDRVWGFSSNFPTTWQAEVPDDPGAIGLVGVAPFPRNDFEAKGLSTEPRAEWRVGIDFGSTKTVVVQQAGTPRIGQVGFAGRVVALAGMAEEAERDFFLGTDRDGFVTAVWMPTQVLAQIDPTQAWLPCDGMIYGGHDPNGQWESLRSDLKWRPSGGVQAEEANRAFRHFLTHLYLSIKAEAAAQNATILSVHASFPAAFSPVQAAEFEVALQDAVERVDGKGRGRIVEVRLPEDEALQFYMQVVRRKIPQQGFLAADVGGSTTDIVVCGPGYGVGGGRSVVARHLSFRLAGSLLLRALQATNDRNQSDGLLVLFARYCSANGKDPSLERYTDGLRSPSTAERAAGLLVSRIMERESTRKEFRRFLETQGGESGQKVLASVAFLFATTAFLGGLLVNEWEGPEEPGEDVAVAFQRWNDYSLHLAGRGGQLLSWLEGDGSRFLDIGAFGSHFFRAGLRYGRDGSEQAAVQVATSPAADVKLEVAQGVLSDREANAPGADKRLLFVGEDRFPFGALGHLGWRQIFYSQRVKLSRVRELDAGLGAPIAEGGSLDLPVLGTFLRAWVDFQMFEPMHSLGIGVATLSNSEFRSHLNSALFGARSTFDEAILAKTAEQEKGVHVTPLIVSELLALLSYAVAPDDPNWLT